MIVTIPQIMLPDLDHRQCRRLMGEYVPGFRFQLPGHGDLPALGIGIGIKQVIDPGDKATLGSAARFRFTVFIQLMFPDSDPGLNIPGLHHFNDTPPAHRSICIGADIVAHFGQLRISGWSLADTRRDGDFRGNGGIGGETLSGGTPCKQESHNRQG